MHTLASLANQSHVIHLIMKFYSLSTLALPLALAETKFGHLNQSAQDEPPRGRTNSGVEAGTLNNVVPMTDALRKLWVDKHNEWRNQAAAGELADRDGNTVQAKYLPKLTYDMDLERNSEEYAKLCNWDHSKPAGFTTLPYSIGENLYVTSAHTSNSQHEQALQGWSIEHEDYSYSADDCNPGKMCGHYTQVVDMRSTRVGCAMVDCASMVNIGSVFGTSGGTYAICQYYGPGNYWGTTSFDYGATGSECPNGMDSDYPNLCATVGEDPCDLPETGSDRCAPGGTCSAAGPLINGFPADFECTCDGNFQGRWCEGSTCTDQQFHVGKKLNGYSGIYFLNSSNQPEAGLNGGGIFVFQGHEKDAANNWCSSNADNAFACKSIVKTDFDGGYYFWVPNKLAPEDMPVKDDASGQGEVWARDCSAAVAPEPTPSEPTPAPVESEPTPVPVVESEPTPAPIVESEPTPAPVESAESVATPASEPASAAALNLLSNNGWLKIGSGNHCVAAAGKAVTVVDCDASDDKNQQWTFINGAICQAKKSDSCLESKLKEKKGVFSGTIKLGKLKNAKKVPAKNAFVFENGALKPDGVDANVLWVPKAGAKKQVLSVNALKQVSNFGSFW